MGIACCQAKKNIKEIKHKSIQNIQPAYYHN